jgi:hypothetical protein
MKSNSNLTKKVMLGIALLGVIGLLGLATAGAERPLSKDDVSLLLLGGSPGDKIIQTVQQRGIDFQMSPDLAKKFHDLGASDDLIEALQKAANKPAAVTPSAPPPASKPNAPEAIPEPAPAEGKPNAPETPAAAPVPATPAAPAAPPPSSSEPVLHVRKPAAPPAPAVASTPGPAPASAQPSPTSVPVAPAATEKPAAPAAETTASTPGLKDPSPEEIQRIIREFAAKEKVFRAARNNYTYHQINKVQELGPDNEVVGTYEQEWDILYDDSGKRIERVTYAPTATLKGLIVTQEDIENFRNIQPFVLTTDDLPEYDIKYLGHVKVDQIVAYVFSLRPKEIQKNRLYFQGVVWVDDRDLQIVKSEGKTVPELKSKGQNLFPRFTTWREQIDGKFWFPTYTLADDTLYFPQGPPVHMKEIVRYTDYKQFKSGVRILNVESMDKQKEPAAPPPAAPKK